MKILGYIWAAPLSLLGLLVAYVGGARYRERQGALLFVARTGWPLAWFFRSFSVVAFTWGWVVVFRDPRALQNGRTLRHEMEHVRQAGLYGPFFPIAYGLASAWAAAHGQRPYADNFFEVQARRVAA